jgi:hypothetical protein
MNGKSFGRAGLQRETNVAAYWQLIIHARGVIYGE